MVATLVATIASAISIARSSNCISVIICVREGYHDDDDDDDDDEDV